MGRGLDGYFLMPVLAGCAVLRVRAEAPAASASRFAGHAAARCAGGLEQFPVALAWGKHLFPFRTEQLSPTAPMVLGPHRPGRVGRRRFLPYEPPSGAALLRSRRSRLAPRPSLGQALGSGRLVRHVRTAGTEGAVGALPAPMTS